MSEALTHSAGSAGRARSFSGEAAAPVQDLLVPLRRQTPVSRANPVAKLAAVVVLMLGVLLSIDLVSAGVMFALLAVIAVPASGLDVGALIRRLWFLPVAALLAGWATAIMAEKTGAVLLDLGPYLVTTDSLSAGAAITLRALALALPGVCVAATTDPTDLADALVQHLRLPERFVLSALAAARLVTLFVEEWKTLVLARRTRGIGADSPLGRVRALVPLAFALLVQAIRRGTRLAMAMEGRGFGTRARTWSRISRFHARDAWLVAGACVFSALSIGAAVVAGAWRLILT
ncbi:energy-coupling factor transporter transmembrane component T family protein [Brevibacterium album]|uniref:energy-coupling factor transporter transmembrane component T family protein n=1 Tax=Brevibacterium album TaxID=417948 RepID=UPI000404AAF2|nr:energy-coupling factor transporter transmembrane component T [Brevibacterium album]